MPGVVFLYDSDDTKIRSLAVLTGGRRGGGHGGAGLLCGSGHDGKARTYDSSQRGGGLAAPRTRHLLRLLCASEARLVDRPGIMPGRLHPRSGSRQRTAAAEQVHRSVEPGRCDPLRIAGPGLPADHLGARGAEGSHLAQACGEHVELQ